MKETGPTQRIDIWLWHARFFKTRSLSTKICRAGKVRQNGQILRKANILIKAGDILTFAKADVIRIIKVRALGQRRGPALEAQKLYEDLTPPPAVQAQAEKEKVAPRDKGAGRPTKAERRALDKLRDVMED